jgi:hypothetical protein
MQIYIVMAADQNISAAITIQIAPYFPLGNRGIATSNPPFSLLMYGPFSGKRNTRKEDHLIKDVFSAKYTSRHHLIEIV